MKIWDREGFMEHCKVASLIIKEMGLNSHTNHHIRGAIREASNKVTPLAGNDNKKRAKNMSVEAEKQMINGNFSGLVADHSVPVSHINSLIIKLDKPSPDDIATVILKWSSLTVITKEEDKILKEKKLTQSMPHKWNGKDDLARYRLVGIEISPNRYKELYKKSSKKDASS